MKTTQLFASSQPDLQTEENEDFMVSHVHTPGSPLSEKSLKELTALEELKDEEIDFSDIPEWTEEDFRNAVRGPWTEREPHTMTLHVDQEVAEWLEKSAKSRSFLINFVLKREAQREKRVREQSVPQLDKAS